MKHVVVPEVATDEMVEAIDTEYRKVGGHVKDFYQAAIAAAPDTGMIAVDKNILNTLLEGSYLDWGSLLDDMAEGQQKERFRARFKKYKDAQSYINQALKDMEGDNG